MRKQNLVIKYLHHIYIYIYIYIYDRIKLLSYKTFFFLISFFLAGNVFAACPTVINTATTFTQWQDANCSGVDSGNIFNITSGTHTSADVYKIAAGKSASDYLSNNFFNISNSTFSQQDGELYAGFFDAINLTELLFNSNKLNIDNVKFSDGTAKEWYLYGVYINNGYSNSITGNEVNIKNVDDNLTKFKRISSLYLELGSGALSSLIEIKNNNVKIEDSDKLYFYNDFTNNKPANIFGGYVNSASGKNRNISLSDNYISIKNSTIDVENSNDISCRDNFFSMDCMSIAGSFSTAGIEKSKHTNNSIVIDNSIITNIITIYRNDNGTPSDTTDDFDEENAMNLEFYGARSLGANADMSLNNITIKNNSDFTGYFMLFMGAFNGGSGINKDNFLLIENSNFDLTYAFFVASFNNNSNIDNKIDIIGSTFSNTSGIDGRGPQISGAIGVGNNTETNVNIAGSIFDVNITIWGAMNEGAGSNTHNTVSISAGTTFKSFTDIFGGMIDTGDASHNSVIIEDSTFEEHYDTSSLPPDPDGYANIYGSMVNTGNTSYNNVLISSNTTFETESKIYGGMVAGTWVDTSYIDGATGNWVYDGYLDGGGAMLLIIAWKSKMLFLKCLLVYLVVILKLVVILSIIV
ncbi:MAG: hypothetical protein Ta2D_02800 [Rickettsiales bacterium]|nr:MAG: hypothetical protein Ta2D_02800 [Rickettsiales bacterium]